MNKRILVVDDEPDILKVVVFRLSKMGYEIQSAVNGKQALEMAREMRPDLILLDYRMPEMDGHEVCRELKSDSTLKGVPVVLMTASIGGVTPQILESIGVDDHIIKPFEPEELFDKIKRIIG